MLSVGLDCAHCFVSGNVFVTDLSLTLWFALFLVVIDWWFPLLSLSSLVEVPRCLSYYQDSVLIVPFLLLFDFPVRHILFFFVFLLHFYVMVFVKIVAHYAGLQDSYHFLLTVLYHMSGASASITCSRLSSISHMQT